MHRIIVVGLLIVGRSMVAPPPTGAFQDRSLPTATASEVGLDADLVRRADSVADRDLPALLSLLVVRRGKLALERYYHGATAATAINVKSVSKSIQSATVGVARAAGLIANLDEPVAAILPELYARPVPTYSGFAAAIRQMDAARRQVTLRHLLAMSSGYGWQETGLVMNAFLVNPHPAQFVADLPMESPPGATFHYSTGATHLLSAAIAKKTGMNPRTFTETRLLEPAGIRLLGWDADPQGINIGGSEMLLTSLGMARFGLLFLGGGTIDGRRIIPSEWVEQSWAKQIEVKTPVYRDLIPGLDGYGYLWWRRSVSGVAWYCALGFGGQFVLIAPSLDVVVAGGSALDGRNPGMQKQFEGIFQLVDRYLQPAAGR
ncbi:MAG: serine hydrolase domain-containing protein [Gemmatimonadales bacterium]